MPNVEEESDTSSGTVSSPTRSSPIVLARRSPSLSKLPAADQSRDSGGSAMKGDTTPSPRQIPLFKFTPSSKTWKQKAVSPSPALSRPTLGIVPSNKDPQEKKKETDQPGLAVTGKQAENRLLNLLRSRFTVGKFHNVTVDKTELPHLARTNNTASKFVFANDSAKVRSKSLEKGSKRPDKEIPTTADDLKDRLTTSNEASTRNRTFTSSVKNLLQGNRQDKDTKDAASLETLKKTHIGETQLNQSQIKENSMTPKTAEVEQKDKKEVLSPKKSSASAMKRSYDETVAQSQQPEGATVPVGKSPKKPRHDSPPIEDEGVKIPSPVPKPDTGSEDKSKVIPSDQAPNIKSLPIFSFKNKKAIQNGNVDKTLAVRESRKEESERNHKIESSKEEQQVNKENTDVNPSQSTTAKEMTDVHNTGPLAGIEEKWNNALAREPSNSFAQRQALADLFTKLYQNNLLTVPKYGRLGDSGTSSNPPHDHQPNQPTEARIVTDLELFSNEDTNPKRPVVKPREKQHHLKGAVVFKEMALAKPSIDLPLKKETSTSKAELHYMTESEDSSSDSENQSLKDPSRQGSIRDSSAEEQSASHVTLHENSVVSRPNSSGKDRSSQDPEIERRKINRELTINVMHMLGKKSWFDRTSVVNLVEPGIAKHAPMASHPQVSVTNNICSAKNYEQSHAYYYQQMHKRGKLEFIPLRGRLKVEYGTEDKKTSLKAPVKPQTSKQVQPVEGRSSETWKNNWRSSLRGCYVFFDFSPPTNSQDHSDRCSKQIAQLRAIFNVEFGVKIAAQLDEGVEIVISSDSSKASTVVENIRHDPLKAQSLSKNLRVWSLQKAYNFVENMGIDIKEWTTRLGTAAQAPITKKLAETPIKTSTATPPEISSAEIAVSKTPVAKDFVVKEPVAVAHVPTVPVVNVQATNAAVAATEEPAAQVPAVEAAPMKIPITESPAAKAAAKEPTVQKTTTKPLASETPAKKVPVTKAFITAAPVPKSVASDAEGSRPSIILKQDQPGIKTPSIGPPLLSLEQITPTVENGPLPRTARAGYTDVDVGKTDTETESDAEDNDLEAILHEASETLEKKDKQIEAARKLILSLCQDVMKKELMITSLTGQLKDTQQKLEDKEKRIEDYVTTLVQKELQLVRMTENRERRASESYK